MGNNGTNSPSLVVLQLPSGDLPTQAIELLVGMLGRTEKLILGFSQPLSEQLNAGWLEPLRATANRPKLQLRMTAVGDLDAAILGLSDLEFTEIEITLKDHDTTELDKAIQLAARQEVALPEGGQDQQHSKVRPRFVLTPENWFWVEATAAAAAARNLQLDLVVVDRNDKTPMASMPVKELATVKDILGSIPSRFSEEQRPSSLDPKAYTNMLSELRELLRDRAKSALGAEEGHDEEPRLKLPPLDHPWHLDEEVAPHLHTQLLNHSDSEIIDPWLAGILDTADPQQLLCQHTWLRILCQKSAYRTRNSSILRILRDAYADKDTAKDLLEADAAFNSRIELKPYGGPWTELLGLQPPKRCAPFEITTSQPPTNEGDAQITVLIPSYKHEQFIVDTIQSALAQTSVPLKVLVVDDQSPDQTVAKALSINDPRLEVRVNDHNLGLGNSVLQALETIETPYVALLNSDDVLHPDRLARCLEVLDANPKTHIVTTGLALIDQQGDELTPDNVSLAHDGLQIFNWVHWYESARATHDLASEAVFEELLERNFLATSSNLTARTEWLRKNRDAFLGLKYCLDWQIFLEASLGGALQHIAAPLAGYRLHETNTVWFDDDRRWAFFLEVNRVLANALKSCIAHQGDLDEALVHRVANAIINHAASNRESDGYGLLLNSLLNGTKVAEIAGDSPRVQHLIQQLTQSAAADLANRDATARRTAKQTTDDELQRLLASLQRDQITEERDSERNRATRLATSVERLNEHADDAKLQRKDLEARAEELTARLQALRKELQDLRKEGQVQREALEGRLADTSSREQTLRSRLATLRADIEKTRQEAASIRTQLAETQTQLSSSQTQLSSSKEKRSQLEGRLQGLQGAMDELKSATDQQITKLQERRNQLITEGSQLRDEMEKLRNSREFRSGNFLWNKLPLSYMSRRGKNWYDRLIDAKNRVSLWASSMFRKNNAEGVAVVASCWHWPIYSHTFVYQEMVSMTHMGLELKMFHWAANELDQLQPAFSYLKDNRLQIKSNMQQHKKDKDYFEKAKPGRLDELLQRIATATDKTVEELSEDPMVLRACTFARMAELANANYLHSYFFYDQSFMIFVASWLLEIPRGVSCYADHMMDDFPLKLVPLQLQMADVVVATSARIKTELVGLGGEACADKIVVKPNGVNGERFPAIDRGMRKPEDPFEVISISRLEPKKGLEYMIDAVANLKKRGHRIIVHIVGAVDTSLQASIDYGAEIKNQVKTLGLENEVILHGMKMHEEIAPIMHRSRAFVAPYVELESGDKDGIPTAMLEALASGLPIITTDAGSILEVVQDDKQALVTPQRDAKAYGDALEKLITNPQLEMRLAKAARQRFDQEFDIKVTETRLHQRIAALLKPSPAKR